MVSQTNKQDNFHRKIFGDRCDVCGEILQEDEDGKLYCENCRDEDDVHTHIDNEDEEEDEEE